MFFKVNPKETYMDTKIDGRYTEAMIDELDWHEPTIADSVVQQDGGRLDEDGVVIAGAALGACPRTNV
jgi:hypothetical protein